MDRNKTIDVLNGLNLDVPEGEPATPPLVPELLCELHLGIRQVALGGGEAEEAPRPRRVQPSVRRQVGERG